MDMYLIPSVLNTMVSVNNVSVRTARMRWYFTPQPDCLYKVRSGNPTPPLEVLADAISQVPPEETDKEIAT